MKKKDPWRHVSADKFTLKKQLKEVTAQRDLLLGALGDLVEIERRDNVGNPDVMATERWRKQAWDNARAAIAAVKREA